MPPRPRPGSPSNRPEKSRPAKRNPGRPGGQARNFRRPDQAAESRGSRIAANVVPDEVDESGEDGDRMRLQKFLAMAGVDSRRKCEEYIRTGRVTVDAEVVTDPARSVNPLKQDVRLDSERLRMPRLRYFLVNKPKGFLCTNHDPQGRPKAVDLVPASEQRMFTVGRLDEMTQGMLLITNDGDLAQRLAHPRFEVIRRYRCHVAGIPHPETLKQLREGMYFAEGFFKFRNVHIHRRKGQSAILEMELQEGKNREIRRLMARVGHKVLALERIEFGPLQLGSLAPGRHRELQPFEIHELRYFAEHGEKPASAQPRKGTSFGYRTGQTRAPRRRADSAIDRPAPKAPAAEGVSTRPPMPTGPIPSLRDPRPSAPDSKTAVPERGAPRQEARSTRQESRTRVAEQRPPQREVRGRAADRRPPMKERPPVRERRPATQDGRAPVKEVAQKNPNLSLDPIRKPVARKKPASKAAKRKPFRPADDKPAKPINKGRDRRRNK
jgi:23S rRNA pseudouridine2605 synthase